MLLINNKSSVSYLSLAVIWQWNNLISTPSSFKWFYKYIVLKCHGYEFIFSLSINKIRGWRIQFFLREREIERAHLNIDFFISSGSSELFLLTICPLSVVVVVVVFVVVVNFFIFSSSSQVPLGQFQPNLAQNILGWRGLKFFKWRAAPFTKGR